ncbi:GNAT family N-acetyltransferase [Streptomyces olivoreticuli]
MYPVSYSSPRLALRELTTDDVDPVHAIYGDPDATRHLSFEPRTRDQVAQLITRTVESATTTPRSEYGLAVIRRADSELIGFARLATEPQQAATIGFALRPDTWGTGYGTETVRALLSLGFDTLKLHRIWAARSPANDASAKVLLRVGLTEEGRIRHHVHVRGQWRDSITYSILEDEWRTPTAQ